jgi:hypothetical protein
MLEKLGDKIFKGKLGCIVLGVAVVPKMSLLSGLAHAMFALRI